VGTVPIWKQWLIIAASAFLSPVIVLAVACAFGWVIFRRLWPRRVVAGISTCAGSRGGRFRPVKRFGWANPRQKDAARESVRAEPAQLD